MNIQAAPVPFNAAGCDFMLYPLTDRAIQTVNNWVRGCFIASVRGSNVNVPDEQSTANMELAYKTALSIDWLSKEGKLAVLTRAGQAVLLRESTKHQISLDECRQILADEETALTFWDSFLLVNDCLLDSKKKAPAQLRQNSETAPNFIGRCLKIMGFYRRNLPTKRQRN